MGHPARDIFSAALSLPEAERLELASHLIASVDGPAEPDWEDSWIEELEARERLMVEAGAPWFEVRGRMVGRIGRR